MLLWTSVSLHILDFLKNVSQANTCLWSSKSHLAGQGTAHGFSPCLFVSCHQANAIPFEKPPPPSGMTHCWQPFLPPAPKPMVSKQKGSRNLPRNGIFNLLCKRTRDSNQSSIAGLLVLGDGQQYKTRGKKARISEISALLSLPLVIKLAIIFRNKVIFSHSVRWQQLR